MVQSESRRTVWRPQSPISEITDMSRQGPHDATKNNKHNNPWHAIGCFAKNVANGVQGHATRWKKEQDRKKLESHIAIVQKVRQDMETKSDGNMSRTQSSPTLHSLGDIGMTLFSPLDGHFEMVNSDVTNNRCTEESEADSVTVEESDDDDNDILVEADGTEPESPHLLTIDMMGELRQAMPTPVQLKVWKRLYSVARDGDAFKSFTTSVVGHRQILLVIQTLSGEIFGGFADAHWGNLTLRNDGSYHGTGRSFLFSIDSSRKCLSSSPCTVMIPDESPDVVIHPWQGVNEYSILCSTNDGGRLAMGGGGADASFGFCVQDYFTKGSSGPCATFGNKEPLCGSAHFEVMNFEVYGFVNSW